MKLCFSRLFRILFVILFAFVLLPFFNSVEGTSTVSLAQPVTNPVLDRMISKAEATVNYEWVPETDIICWDYENYNGLTYFPKGTTVKGVPYSLFSFELDVDSLLSLDQYKEVASKNYSVTRYCRSVGAMRTGPVWGSCCATFVSDVLGGDFVTPGGNPRYDNCTDILDNPYALYLGYLDVSELRAGDILVNTAGTHVIWVSSITDDEITVYEQVPPVARKSVYKLSEHTEDGKLVIVNDWGVTRIYSEVARSKELLSTDATGFYPTPLLCTPIKNQTIPLYQDDMETVIGTVPAGTACTITAFNTNGTCYVTVDNLSGYAYWTDFITTGLQYMKQENMNNLTVYADSGLTSSLSEVPDGTTVYIADQTETAFRVLYYDHSVGWISGWADAKRFSIPDVKITYYDGISETPYLVQDACSGDVNLTCTVPSREGYTFLGWFDGQKLYKPGDNVNISENCSFYGKWKLSDEAIQLVAPSETLRAGDTFTVQLKLNGVTGAVTGLIDYDENIFESFSFRWGAFGNGILEKNAFSHTSVESGPLLYLSFTVLDGVASGTYPIAFSITDESSDTVSSTCYIEVTEDSPGDANGDSLIDGKDVVLILQYLAEYDYQTQVSSVAISNGADANLDGCVDGKDSVLLLKYLSDYDYQTNTSSVKLGKQ